MGDYKELYGIKVTQNICIAMLCYSNISVQLLCLKFDYNSILWIKMIGYPEYLGLLNLPVMQCDTLSRSAHDHKFGPFL